MSEEPNYVSEVVGALCTDPSLLQLILSRIKRDQGAQRLDASSSYQEVEQQLAASIDVAIEQVVQELRIEDTLKKFREEVQLRESRTLLPSANAHSTAALVTPNGGDHSGADAKRQDEEGHQSLINDSKQDDSKQDVIAADRNESQPLHEGKNAEEGDGDDNDFGNQVQPPKFSSSSPSQTKHPHRDLSECQLPFVKPATSPPASLSVFSPATDEQAQEKASAQLQRSTDDLVVQADSPNQSQMLGYADDFEESVDKAANDKRVSFAPGDVTAVHEIREKFTEAQAKDLFFSGPMDLFDEDSHAPEHAADDEIGIVEDITFDGELPEEDNSRLSSYDEFVDFDAAISVGSDDDDSDAF